MGNWLFKTEPKVFSVGDIAAADGQICVWDGIRNFQARNFLRDQTAFDDRVFIYHCQCSKPGIYGIARIHRAGYPDPAQYDRSSPYFDAGATPSNPRWYCVDLQLVHLLTEPILLSLLKTDHTLAGLGLFKQPRLSVVPVTPVENLVLMALVHD
jgi:predicted RNA-binding protein with PUA-like domain